MVLNILILVKTFLYADITNINHDKLVIILITSLITIGWLSLINITKLGDRTKKILSLLVYSIFSLIIFADTLYYIQFNMLPSIRLLGQAGQLSDVWEAVGSILSPANLFLIGDLPFVAYYILRSQNYSYKLRPPYPLGLLCLLLAYMGLGGNLRSLASQELYSYHVLDIIGPREPRQVARISQEDVEDLRERARLKPGAYTGVAQGKNVIVVQVEALQNFVIGLRHKGVEVTPNLNRLVQEEGSIYYDRYYQLVGRGNTSDAEFVSNNSLHPAMDQPSYTRYEANSFYGLPRLLEDYNYGTIAMHGYKREFWNREKAYKAQGFKDYLSQEFYQGREEIGMGVSDQEFFKANVAYLKEFSQEEKRPFYAFMVSLTSHTPFKLDRAYQDLDLEPIYRDTIVGDYLQAIHYTDRQLGLLVEELKEAGLYQDTLLAIYGDHFAIKASNQEEADLMTQLLGFKYDYDTMMNIPLLIHMDGLGQAQVNSQVGSQIDLYPTLQNLLGYENKKGLVFGRDLNNFQGENTVKPQTYMKKGSFIKEDIAFEMARDGVFDHSRAYNIRTREELDIKPLRPYYDQAIREINLGDFIAGKNKLKEYMARGRIDLEAQEGELRSYIDWQDLDLARPQDYKGLSLYVDLEKVQDLGSLVDWANDQGLELILAGPREDLFEIYGQYNLENHVARITDMEDYVYLTNNRYRKILLDPYVKNYKKSDMENFISSYPELALDLKARHVKSYQARGVNIYKIKK